MSRWIGGLAVLLMCWGCVPDGGGEGEGGDATPPETDAVACTPDCEGRACGDDGCGGSCGACAEGEVCTAAGACFEVPASCGDGTCAEADGETCETCPADCGACCGDGACTEAQGENCGTCPADCGCPEGEACGGGGVCEPACVPDCDGRACGADGCGGSCGECPEGEVCGGDGACAPPPDSCGDGACDAGEDCANCAADCACEAGQDCTNGMCVDAPRCGDGACDPGEDCGSCAADCACEAGQDCTDGMCVDAPRCGDGACDPGEDCGRCAADCACEAGQNCEAGVCVDAPRCGDGVCGADEDCGNCAADCACDEGLDCVNNECVCVPACGGAECGGDGCGGSCGACAEGAVCAGGQCVFECPDDCGEPWVGACTVDGFGLRVCIPDPERPGCTMPSRRIPCGEGRDCGGGACAGSCVKPEVIVLVDRSSSMIGERWQFTRDTLIGNSGDRADTARLGLRTFPSAGDGCAAGGITAPAFEAQNTFQRMPDPAQVAQTPIAAAFDGIEVVFGDPDEGESVILITDGDETCEAELAAVERVEALRRRGIRTFAVGISRQANGELLAAIAEAGGTARDGGPPYYVVDDAAELRAALDDIFARLETCVCAEGERRCTGDVREICAADGFDFEAEEVCAFGCDPGPVECFPVCNPADETVTCNGDQVKRCNAAGDGFAIPTVCALGCRADGACNAACRPGQRRCVDGASELCNVEGDGFDPVENCETCDTGTGLCVGERFCAPLRDFRCGEAGVEICAADGLGFELYAECECDPNTARCRSVTAEAQVRLVGESPESGLLEVWHAGQWGTVCDDSFLLGEETVVCQQLGYPRRVAQFDAAGQGVIWLDDLACDGTEANLGECGFDAWGREDCGHNEDVGLTCEVPEPGAVFCDNPETSYLFLGEGVVRFQPCVTGCDEVTGLCNEQIVVPELVALPPNETYAYHGSCGSWNECNNAEGCADFACQFFGHGLAESWVETNACDADGRTCRPYNENNGTYDARWNSRADCQLPGVYEVVCEPAP